MSNPFSWVFFYIIGFVMGVYFGFSLCETFK